MIVMAHYNIYNHEIQSIFWPLKHETNSLKNQRIESTENFAGRNAQKDQDNSWPCVFIVCWLLALNPSNMLVYLSDRSAQTIVHAATLRQNLHNKTFHLTQSQHTDTGPPALPQTLCQAPGRVATDAPVFKSLV